MAHSSRLATRLLLVIGTAFIMQGLHRHLEAPVAEQPIPATEAVSTLSHQ